MSSNTAPYARTLDDSSLFRRACSRFATGITVVTVIDAEGMPHGMTVNSFTAVSLDPPLVLICIDNRAAIQPLLLSAQAFAVNVLSEDQQQLSEKFSRPGEDRFGAVDWFPGDSGVPILPGVLAAYECSIVNLVDAGDHKVLIAEVRHLQCCDGQPLLYYNSAYRVLPLT
jgi:flavin reductase (DIM6/NTAB) family NADH-FMN oxidoreductase RutF